MRVLCRHAALTSKSLMEACFLGTCNLRSWGPPEDMHGAKGRCPATSIILRLACIEVYRHQSSQSSAVWLFQCMKFRMFSAFQCDDFPQFRGILNLQDFLSPDLVAISWSKLCMWNSGGSSIWTRQAHTNRQNAVSLDPDGHTRVGK